MMPSIREEGSFSSPDDSDVHDENYGSHSPKLGPVIRLASSEGKFHVRLWLLISLSVRSNVVKY